MGMRKTNMSEVRRIARAFLMIDPVKTQFSPLVVIHPFTNTGIVPLRKGKEIELVDISDNKDNLRRWQKDVTEAIDKESNPHVIQIIYNTLQRQKSIS